MSFQWKRVEIRGKKKTYSKKLSSAKRGYDHIHRRLSAILKATIGHCQICHKDGKCNHHKCRNSFCRNGTICGDTTCAMWICRACHLKIHNEI